MPLGCIAVAKQLSRHKWEVINERHQQGSYPWCRGSDEIAGLSRFSVFIVANAYEKWYDPDEIEGLKLPEEPCLSRCTGEVVALLLFSNR